MARKLSRRAFTAGAAASTAFGFAPVIAQAAPFKIGLLAIKTGPLAQGGIQMEQGIAAFLKEKGNTLAGRKVEFISADTGGNPAGAKTKAQELIERTGSMSSSARRRRSSCWRSSTTCARRRRR
jgi:branched-chain amino acid transport system substrate-binding protein